MSQSNSNSNDGSGDSTGYQRSPARRVLAGEYNDATYAFKEEDREQAPNYVLLPTGQRANRVFVCGVVTEIEDLADDPNETFYRARVVDLTGTFRVYAGKYNPEAELALSEMEVPQPVAVVGKTRVFDPEEDGDEEADPDDEPQAQIRAETVDPIDIETRHRWVAEAADKTLERIEDDDRSDGYNELVRENYEMGHGDYVDTVIESLTQLEDDDTNESAPNAETDSASA
jgi:RPA family protein